ncbi:MAG: hypothetical protein VX938_02825, partial [Myxococcota bacterium]|nr:hypothetical protein [Myxococcota bacterium]
DDSVASAACVASACAVVTCEEGLYDLDGDWATGCEYGCVAAGDESCNGADDDCDGETDEAHQCPSETSDIVGICGEDGVCATAPCDANTWDVDGDPSNGCEYECVKTSVDDIDACGWGDEDCDGETDEDGESCAPPGTSVVGMYATDGGSHGTNCALRGDGSVWCWGNGWNGQLGNGKQQYDQATPQRVLKVYDPPQALSGIVTMDSNAYGSCAIDADGQTHCWAATKYFGGDLSINTLYTASGTILDSDGVTPLQGLVSLAQGKYGGCGVMEDGTVRCWGTNKWGSLGNGTDGNGLSLPVVVLGPDAQAPLSGAVGLAASFGHNEKESRCAILDDETLWCWGRNYEGQLGIGLSGTGYESEPLPVQVHGPYGGFLEGVTDVDCGYEFCCAVAPNPFDPDNTQAWCWGSGGYGQLGQGSLAASSTPVGVVTNQLGDPLVGVTSISAGSSHACATTEANEVYCWGDGQNGALADPHAGTRPWAEVIPGLDDAIGVIAGASVTCAWTAQGEAYCWGWNHRGHLGLGFFGADKPVPQQVQGLPEVVDIEVGNHMVCARAADGTTTTCWGDNDFGQLGTGSTTARPAPDEPVQ